MIYCIYLIENPYAKLVDCLGRELYTPGSPLEFIGYFETYEEAKHAMQDLLVDENEQEGKFGGFIVKRKPGLDIGCCQDEREFFLWDPDKEGFYKHEEPEIWKYVAI